MSRQSHPQALAHSLDGRWGNRGYTASEYRDGLGLSHQLLRHLRHSEGLRGSQKTGSPDEMNSSTQQGSGFFQTCPEPLGTQPPVLHTGREVFNRAGRMGALAQA